MKRLDSGMSATLFLLSFARIAPQMKDAKFERRIALTVLHKSVKPSDIYLVLKHTRYIYVKEKICVDDVIGEALVLKLTTAHVVLKVAKTKVSGNN